MCYAVVWQYLIATVCVLFAVLSDLHIYNNYYTFWFWIFHLVGEVSLTSRRTADDPGSFSATDVGCILIICVIRQGGNLNLQTTDVTNIWYACSGFTGTWMREWEVFMLFTSNANLRPKTIQKGNINIHILATFFLHFLFFSVYPYSI